MDVAWKDRKQEEAAVEDRIPRSGAAQDHDGERWEEEVEDREADSIGEAAHCVL